VKPSIVYLRPRAVAFTRVRGPYATSVPEAWESMFSWLDQRGFRNRVSVGYGLAHDDPRSVAGEDCRYDACVELGLDTLAEAGGEIRTQNLPGGAYVRSRVIGSYHAISKALVSVRDQWLPGQRFSMDKGRPVIAIYLSDPLLVAEGARKADVCLPIAAR
jgi:AraC family transcriptional regulator